jgi:hypothetical protein
MVNLTNNMSNNIIISPNIGDYFVIFWDTNEWKYKDPSGINTYNGWNSIENTSINVNNNNIIIWTTSVLANTTNTISKTSSDQVGSGGVGYTPYGATNGEALALTNDGRSYYIIYTGGELASGPIRINAYWAASETEPASLLQSRACFSENTLLKIMDNIDYEHFTGLITKSTRNNKKMYRCYLFDYGKIEFTADHPFIYNNQVYKFESLIKILPNVNNIEEIQNNECNIIYNIIGHKTQLNHKNVFILTNDICMIGGCYTGDDVWNDLETKHTFANVLKDKNNNAYMEYKLDNKDINKIINSNLDNNNELQIFTII